MPMMYNGAIIYGITYSLLNNIDPKLLAQSVIVGQVTYQGHFHYP